MITGEAHGVAPPVGMWTEDALKGFKRTATGRGGGQARGVSAEDVAAVLATARAYGLEDAAIAALLFQGGLRRSEIAALRWRDVRDAADGQGIPVAVRPSRTDQPPVPPAGR